MAKSFNVPISSPTNNPIVVSVAPNPAMGAWDLAIDIGNFKSKEDAEKLGHKVADVLREVIGATMHRSQ
jgi:hypothetical protein